MAECSRGHRIGNAGAENCHTEDRPDPRRAGGWTRRRLGAATLHRKTVSSLAGAKLPKSITLDILIYVDMLEARSC
jgi:hypothetical protein